jgi:DNA-binding response OmpR family regulator
VTKKVLIVEDEEDVAALIEEVLELEGFQARIASGESALDDALSLRPDVVLLDLMMPGVDGFEVARRLQAHTRTRSVPIIVMTAMHDVARKAEEVGAASFLAKPFDISNLVDIVRGITQ